MCVCSQHRSASSAAHRTWTDEELERAAQNLRAAADTAATLAMRETIAVEIENRFEMYLVNCAEDTASLVRAADHPNCRMNARGHVPCAHRGGRPAGGADLYAADVLVHVHAAENHRGKPESGQVEWRATFAALAEIGYTGWVVVEAFGDSVPNLAAATKVWRKTFSNDEHPAGDGAAFLRASRLQLLLSGR